MVPSHFVRRLVASPRVALRGTLRMQMPPLVTGGRFTCMPKGGAKRERVIRRLALRVAQTQSQRNGYFGGYICKRQKIGQLETRKCIANMHQLRELNEGISEFQQQRAVSNRMITDIEMNGTVRGAVEHFHLSINLHENDALFAKCIRSFPTVTVDAQHWLHRLEVEIERVS